MRALSLAAGELLRLDRARGVEVSCREGRVWITEEALPGDVWLRAGERAVLKGTGLALLEADGPAFIHVSKPIPTPA